MAGVSRQAVSAVESGISDPSLRVAMALARTLGLTVEELFGPDRPVENEAEAGQARVMSGRVAAAGTGRRGVQMSACGCWWARAKAHSC